MTVEAGDRVISALVESGALLEGHFLLSSGRHSDRYCQCARLLARPWLAADVVAGLVAQIDVEFDLVLGPAMGGILVAYELARQAGKPNIFCERDERGQMTLRRGFAIEPGDRVLIAEDVTTTFKSCIETARLVSQWGGRVVGVAALVDRSQLDRPPYRLFAAARLNIASWEADGCPLCARGLPFEKPGSRKIFA
ncbi:MAG: orotate phosphoribosyltransferase [Negativicutes bacterium]|nr:orotate phosphoribosyltransferase [Negativicutes bacterium]